MKQLSFGDLAIGEVFEFGPYDSVFAGGAIGPWRKTSARGYTRLSDEMDCIVGSIKARVQRVGLSIEPDWNYQPDMQQYDKLISGFDASVGFSAVRVFVYTDETDSRITSMEYLPWEDGEEATGAVIPGDLLAQIRGLVNSTGLPSLGTK